MRLLAFAASSSKQSINKKLVTYTAGLVENAQVELLDINDYEMPLFSLDKEAELGIPNPAKQFYEKIGAADAIIISFAEHNGSYTAAYKNLYDWASRIDAKVFQNKPMVLLATSPGGRGGQSVLATALATIPHFGGDIKGSLSIPKFFENFDVSTGTLSNPDLQQQLGEILITLANS